MSEQAPLEAEGERVGDCPTIATSLTPTYATVADFEYVASLCNRWHDAFVAEDRRLDRRVDWTQREVRHLWWAVIALAGVCAGLAAALTVVVGVLR